MPRVIAMDLDRNAPTGLGPDLGETLLASTEDRLPEWIWRPGTILSLVWQGQGDFGIVRKDLGETEVEISSIGFRLRRSYAKSVVGSVRPMVVMPKITLPNLVIPVEGGIYQALDGRCLEVRKKRWVNPETKEPVLLPLVPFLVPRSQSAIAAHQPAATHVGSGIQEG